jgi:hypothetical protein
MPKCASCREPTTTRYGLTYACSVDCVIAAAKAKAAKKQLKAQQAANRQHRADKARIKTRRQWMAEAQIAFNAFIRARDWDKPCIDCGQWQQRDSLTGGEWDCGHYRSVGSCPELRFDESNAARQLKQCNRQMSGRAVDYRLGLIARIGLEAVERLEGPHPPKKYTIPELQAIIKEYRAKKRELERIRNESQ